MNVCTVHAAISQSKVVNDRDYIGNESLIPYQLYTRWAGEFIQLKLKAVHPSNRIEFIKTYDNNMGNVYWWCLQEERLR